MKIEKNIPMPKGRSKYPFRDMAVGDSLFFDNYVDGKFRVKTVEGAILAFNKQTERMAREGIFYNAMT